MVCKVLPRRRLDLSRYNQCVANTPSVYPYAFSWHLDIVNPTWVAAILGDYQAVMPLPVNRKIFGLPQIVHPIFAQQLGVFGPLQSNKDTVQKLLTAIPGYFVRAYTQLNTANPLPDLQAWQFDERTNYEIDLSLPYPILKKNYRKGHLANIKKANQLNTIERGLPKGEVMQFVAENPTNGNLNRQRISQLLGKLLDVYDIRQSIWVARLHSGEIGSIGFFPVLPEAHPSYSLTSNEKGRMVYLFSRTGPTGRASFSNHFMIDQVIQHYSGQPRILDFEGSEIPGVATFMKGFGAVNHPYHSAKRHSLI